MGVGHAAVALSASQIAPRINVGLLIFAAFFADFLLGIFAAVGLEHAHVPPDFAFHHYLTFTFPYSHGLTALLLWGILLGALLSRFSPRNGKRAFVLIVALVLSHFLLDALVHVPELPLLGEDSPKLGLALWNHLPLELLLETAMAVVGISLFWRVGNSRAGRIGITVFVLLLTGLTWTQLWMTKPVSSSQLIVSWMVMPVLFAAIPYLIDRKRVSLQR